MLRLLRGPLGMTVLLIAGPLLVGQVLQGMGLELLGAFLRPLAVVLPALLATLAILNLGTLLGGRLMGFQFLLYSIGPLRISRLHGRLVCTLNDSWTLYWGTTASVPTRFPPDANRRMAFYLAAGPVASLLAGVLFTALLVASFALSTDPPTPTWFGLLIFLGPMSLLLAGLMLLPWSSRGTVSIGQQVITYLQGGPTCNRDMARTILSSLNMAGRRPREWSGVYVDLATSLADYSLHDAQGHLFAYLYALDSGQVAAAAAAIDYVLALVDRLSTLVQPGICAEAAYFAGRHRNDPRAARAWLARSAGGWVQPADRARAEAAVLLAEGRLAEAQTRAHAAQAALGQSLGNGTAIAEREWLLEIEELAMHGGLSPATTPVPELRDAAGLALPGAPLPPAPRPRRVARALSIWLVTLGIVLGTLFVLNPLGNSHRETHADEVGSLPSQGTCSEVTDSGTPIPRSLHVGEPAPDFTVDGIPSGSITLSDYQDVQPVWLQFWEPGCNYCRDELPDVETVYQTYKASGLVLIHITAENAPDAVAKLIKTYGYSGFFALAGDRSIYDSYCINAVPAHLFIDRHGTIQRMLVGRAGPSQLKAALDTILGH